MPPKFVGNVDYALSKLKSAKTPPAIQPPESPPPKTPQVALRQYAPGDVVYTGQQTPSSSFSTRLAQNQVIFTQPQFYSPLHTPQNWQIPSKRREQSQWARYFFENEPKVAAAIDFYSKFALAGGFEIQCDDPKIKRFFESLNKKLKIEHWCKHISREYYLVGDVFPFCEIECEKCGGAMVDRDGYPCNHPHGSFRRLVVLNPDWVDVQTNIFADEPVITLLPDDELKRVVWHKQPKKIYDRIPTNVRSLILSGRPIPLDNISVSHLKFNPYPYGTYGVSLIRRLFKVLAYKDKLMTAQWIVAERLILPVRIVKVGDKERPAGPADIADVQQQLAQVASDPNLTLVTHHAFEYDWVGVNGKVLQLSNEYELINKEILQGLMINEALLSGDMPGYSSAAIGAEAIIQRMEEWRQELASWIEERIYKPVSQMKGFVDEEATKEIGNDLGEAIWIVPKVKWDELHLRDKSASDQMLLQLHERGLVSSQTVLEKLDYDYDQEIERVRYETAAQALGQIPAAGGAAGGGAGGGGMPMGGLGGGGAGGGEAPGGLGAPEEVPMGGELGGAPAPGGAPGGAPAGPAAGAMKKIVKPGREKKLPAEEKIQPSHIKLTSLEQKMYKSLLDMRLPFGAYVQFPLGPYRSDFAIPDLKLAVECDGEYWHKQPEAVAKDRKRDSELARYGWTVVRFSEKEIKDRMPDVQYSLSSIIRELWQKVQNQRKQTKQQGIVNPGELIKEAADDVNGIVSLNETISKLKECELVGMLLESEVEPLIDETLKAYAANHGYPVEDSEEGPKDG